VKSLDANIILRVLLNDDEVQSPLARDVMRGPCMILPSVLQEVVWTMSRGERLPRSSVVGALGVLMRMTTVRLVDEAAVAWAADRFAEGADFADMLHLALSGAASAFVTFDTGIERYSDKNTVSVETLSAKA